MGEFVVRQPIVLVPCEKNEQNKAQINEKENNNTFSYKYIFFDLLYFS